MPQSPPIFTYVSYNGQQLRAQWVAGPPSGFTGYQVTLTENAGAGEIFSVLTTSFTLDRVLTPSSTYTLQVAMLVTGQPPSNSSLVTLITQTPTLTSIANSGIQVVYRWTAAGGTGVEGYLASLSSPASDWNNATDATTLTTTFPQALAGAGTCTGWVRGSSSDGVVLGPATPVRTLVTEAPLITLIDNQGSLVVYTWLAAGGSGLEAYIASLDTPAGKWNETTDAAILTATFPQALAGAGLCTGWVRGASSDGVVLGPATPVLTLITQATVLNGLDYDSGALGVTWTPTGEAAVRDYVASVTPAGQPGTDYALGLSGTATAAVTLTPGGSYNVVVRSVAPQLQGPPSNLLQPLTTCAKAFSLTATTSGGFKLSWVADSNPAVTAYLAEFLANGTGQGTLAEPQSPATFPGTIQTGVLYQGQVRSTALNGNLKGPWSPRINGPYQVSLTPTFDALGRLCGLVGDGGISTAYQFDVFGNIQLAAWNPANGLNRCVGIS